MLSHTFKGHIDAKSRHSHILINNATIDMHGRYKCIVKTDLGLFEVEQDLIVISQSNCKLNDWRVVSQPSMCSEFFRLDCKNMFPKPVSSCGLWNGKLDKFIRAVPVDIVEEPGKSTYRISYVDKYELQLPNGGPNPKYTDLLQYAGHLIFKCDILVPETSWKLSLTHRMFDFNDGCNQDPSETVDRMRANFSSYATSRMQQAGFLFGQQTEEVEMLGANLRYELIAPNKSAMTGNEIWPSKVLLNCWQKPRLGTLAKLSCVSKTKQQHFKLIGANLLECQPTGWVPIAQTNLDLRRLSSQPMSNANSRSGRKIATSLSTNEQQMDSTSASSQISNDLQEHSASERPIYDLAVATISPTEVEFIPTTQDILHYDRTSRVEGTSSIPASSAPREIASLLPTCVSTSRRRRPPLDSSKLPLLDRTKPTISQGASLPDTDNTILSSIDGRQQPREPHRSLFSMIFTSSGKSRYKLLDEQVLVLTISIVLALVMPIITCLMLEVKVNL